jgi:hypothetical protein
MAKAYYSTVLDQTAQEVWSVIRSFDHYAWAGVPSETIIEDGRRGDQVGSIRRVFVGDRVIRQILLAHSDLEHSFSYSFVSEPPVAVTNYTATIRVTPVTDTRSSFVEWWATFDASPEKHEHLINHFENEGFAVWLRALRRFMGERRSDG